MKIKQLKNTGTEVYKLCHQTQQLGCAAAKIFNNTVLVTTFARDNSNFCLRMGGVENFQKFCIVVLKNFDC